MTIHLCVSVCVYVYVYIYVYIYVYTVFMYICMLIYIYISMHLVYVFIDWLHVWKYLIFVGNIEEMNREGTIWSFNSSRFVASHMDQVSHGAFLKWMGNYPKFRWLIHGKSHDNPMKILWKSYENPMIQWMTGGSIQWKTSGSCGHHAHLPIDDFHSSDPPER